MTQTVVVHVTITGKSVEDKFDMFVGKPWNMKEFIDDLLVYAYTSKYNENSWFLSDHAVIFTMGHPATRYKLSLITLTDKAGKYITNTGCISDEVYVTLLESHVSTNYPTSYSPLSKHNCCVLL